MIKIKKSLRSLYGQIYKSQNICRILLVNFVTGSDQYYYDDVELAIKAS